MRITQILILSFFLSGQAGTFALSTVKHLPDHPMADAMGFVLMIKGMDTESIITSCVPTMMNPPYQHGWPLDMNNYAGSEGGLLVNADDDPELEILILTLLTVHLFDHDGTYLPGWPVTVPCGNSTSGQSAFGDLDGDGEGEIVVTSDNGSSSNNGWIFAYHSDGTLVDGFPVQTNGYFSRSPTVVDLDNNGTCEIIVGERDYPVGRVYVFDGGGQLLAGWPQEINDVPASSAGAADLDNDGIKEIVFESYQSIYAFKMNGTSLSGFPYTPSTGDVFSYSAPTFADVDGDDYLEIAVGGHKLSDSSHVFLLNHDGTDVTGWPVAVPYWIFAPCTFADMDGDDDLELLVGDQILSTIRTNFLYAWHHDASSVTGWPVGPIRAINAQVAVADIDGDGDPEFIWDTNVRPGKLMGYHHTGVSISGWPITTNGSAFCNTVALGDVDLDGDLEMLELTFGTCGTAHLWDLPDPVDPMNIQMSMFQYGPGRDGLITNPPNHGIENSPSLFSDLTLIASPNPFFSSVTVSVSKLDEAPCNLQVFDLSGRLVIELAPAFNDKEAVYSWNGKSTSGAELPAGIYSARLFSENISSGVLMLKL